MGRSQPLTRLPNGPGSETSSGIFRAYPDISGHSRIRNDHRVPYRSSPDRVPSRPSPDRVPSRPSPDRVPSRPSPDRMPSRPSRREWPVAGSRAVGRVACRIARCRIASRRACRLLTSRRVRYRPSSDTASSCAVSLVAGSRAVSPVAHSRLVPSRPPLATSRLCHVPVRHTTRPSSAHPRPNSACNRRRHRQFTNVYSFTPPWRFIMARSAARLRRGVGPLSTRYAVAGQTEQPDIIGNN